MQYSHNSIDCSSQSPSALPPNLGISYATVSQPKDARLEGYWTHIASSFPLFIPPTSCFFEHLYCGLVFTAVRSKLDLGLLKFRFVLPLFLTHDHVSLGQVPLDPQAVLLVAVSRLRIRQQAVMPGTTETGSQSHSPY